MSDRRPNIECPKCGGCGIVPMGDEAFAVLKTLSNLRGVTATQVSNRIGWKFHPTAINNRLEELRRLNFARREKRGRSWVYFRVL